MQTNPEIEQITDYAIQIAKKKEHEYVLVEHLLLSLIRFKPFASTLESYGVVLSELDNDIDAYLDNVENIGRDETPKKTNALERVFNRAVTQVLFTGRRYVSTIDLYLSITSESQSHASYFLLKHGIDKGGFTEHWNTHYKESDVTLTDTQAKETLEEFCTNLNDLARNDKLEPLIHRYKIHKKTTVHTLGHYPTLSISKARRMRDDNKVLTRQKNSSKTPLTKYEHLK